MTIDKLESEIIYPLHKAKELYEHLNSDSENDQDSWKYELEILPNEKAKIKVFDSDNEFLGYI